MYTFVVDVPKKHSRAIQSVLDESGADYYMVGRKALGFPDSIVVIAATLTIARHVYFFAKELLKKQEKRHPDIDIRIRVYSASQFGPTPHQIATEEELREAIASPPSSEAVDAG